MKKYLLFALFVTGGYAQLLTAQQITPAATTLGRIVSASPEASSIALYQNYPVDYVSGVPDIEIPLFDVPTKAGVLPFKLSYHVGKLRPSELVTGPGWGWTLTPNLGVTRAVKGVADGATSGYPANTLFGQTSDDYYLSIATNVQDEQPDDFFYSLLGNKSGQFIYNRKGGFSQVTADAVKIVRNDDNSFVITDDDGTIYKFGKYSTGSSAMTEASGTSALVTTATWKITEIIPYDKSDTIRFVYGSPTTYIMGYYNIQAQVYEYISPGVTGTSNPVNIYHNVYNSGQGTVLTGAQVMRPQSATTSPFFSTLFDVPLPTMNATDYKLSLAWGSGDTRESAAWSNINYGTDHVADVISDALTDQLPLTEIRFKGGRVGFVYANSNKQLLSVTMYANASGSSEVAVKKAYLYQHALHHENNEQPISYYEGLNTRYGLDSVRLSGPDLTVGATYKMSYALKNTDQECVGVYGNFNTDFWGYPNGSNVFTLPHVLYYVGNFVWNSLLENSDPTNLNGGVKAGGGWVELGSQQESTASDAHYMVPGIIKRLYYPTGGYAEFDFENNQYQSSNDASRVVYGGGFRIKQIKYATGDGRDSITKVYKYGVGENGVGQTKYKNYSQNFISVQWINTTKSGNAGNYLQKVATINSKPFLDMSFASGAAVLYPQVAEYVINPVNNQTLGKTVYSYVINSRNDTWVVNTPLQMDPRTDWRIISNTSIAKYRYNSGVYSIVSKTENTFMDYYTDTIPASQTFLKYYNANPGSTLSSDILYGQPTQITSKFDHISYNIYGGAHKLSSVKETLYNPDDTTQFIATTTTIDYDSIHLYRSRESKTDSKGLLHKTEAFYPYQASQITDLISGQQTVLSALTTANRINKPVETKEYKSGVLALTVQQNFRLYGNNKAFPTGAYAGVLGNALEKKIEVTLYDSINGNLLEQQKANDMKEVYVWGYQAQFPVAKILNSNYATVKALINQTMLDNAKDYTDDQIRTELAKIRTGLAGTTAQVFTYTYKPLTGMTSETDAAGKTIYYQYDLYNRVSLIKDQYGNILKMFEYKVGY